MNILHKSKKILSLALALIFCGIGSSMFATEGDHAPMKIRVGFFEFDGYHQIESDGTKSGYGYDFLQMIAPYANFEYEYIGYEKSWSEMQKMLKNGEIDLLTSAQRTPAREEIFDYSDRCIGFSSTIVTTNPSNTKISIGKNSSFQGARIGMIQNNSRNKSFEEFAKKHNFEYEEVYFENQIIMAQALKENKIDAMVTSDLRTLGNEIILAKFDDSPFFAIVKKGNKEILDRVNLAISTLSSDSPGWVNSLSYKYYNNVYKDNEVVLSVTEKDFLNSLKEKGTKLKILLNPDGAPYSYIEHGKNKGIFFDLLESVSKKVGFEYELIDCKNVSDYKRSLNAKEADIVFDCVMDHFAAEQVGYHLTNPYHVTSISCVTRTNELQDRDRIATTGILSVLDTTYTRFYKNFQTVECNSIQECINAVKSKKADCTYVYTYTAAKYIFEDVKGSLAYTPIADTLTNVSIAVRSNDGPVLFHLMNRIAGSITESEVQTAVANNTNFYYTGTAISYLIYKQPLFFTLIIVAILTIIFTIIGVKRNREKEIALLLVKEGKAKREALEIAYEAAEKANKAKSDFLSKMSHDIRTPMNAIMGMTILAQSHVNEPEHITEYLSKITASSNHLLGLINEVLDMSKIESGTFSLSYEEFNIQKLVKDTVEILMPEIKSHKHNLTLNIHDIQHNNVIGDSLRIQEGFVNIVSNSIKYTPNGGEIEINVREIESNHPKIALYEFVFKDNGIGMSKEFIHKIFDPFSREQDSRVDKIQGTGLGLAITKSIIEMMDGTINVQSEQNKGTTFTITLKLKYQENDADNSNNVQEENTPSSLEDFASFDFSGKKILLVEDNITNREIAREILCMTKVEVDEVENGKAAVEKFKASSPNYYNMIFMDVQMPVMNGHDASLAIRSLNRDDAKSIPIIAMTADAFTEDIEKATRSGMNEHLAKPLDMKKLAAIMQKYLYVVCQEKF